MGQYATKECYECNIRRPAHQMSQKEIEVKVGRSGVSASFNPAKQKSVRVSSGRNYYRKKQVWLCSDKKAHGNPSYYEELEKQKQQQAERGQFTNTLEQQINEEFCDQLSSKSVDRVFEVLSMDGEFKTKLQQAYEELSSELGDRLIPSSETDFAKRFISSLPMQYSKGKGVSLKGLELSKLDFLSNVLPALAKNSSVSEKSKQAWKNRKKMLWIGFFTIPVFGLGALIWAFAKFVYKKNEVSAFLETLKFASSVQSKTNPFHMDVAKRAKPILNRLVLDDLMAKKSVYSNKYFVSAFESLFGKSPYEQKESTTIDIVNSLASSRVDKKITKQFVESEDFFSIACYALAMTVAEADGDFSKEEQKLLEKNLDLSADALKVFQDLAKLSDRNKFVLATLYTMHHDNPALLSEVVHNLFVLADADGEITKDELACIKSIADGLSISTTKFNGIKKVFSA